MSDETIYYSQFAQDPLGGTCEGFDEAYPELAKLNKSTVTKRQGPSAKLKSKRENAKKNNKLSGKSFVMKRETNKGLRLIKIKVLDISDTSTSSENSDVESESDSNVVLRAQYVAKDINDPILSDTEGLIHKISKELCARSKLPKKRRRVLPVEQPRRKVVHQPSASNRRVNAVKHPVVLKELPGSGNKFGVNGMNMISLALQGPPNLLRPPTTTALPLQARAPIVENPLINTCGAISLASLQPPLITVPPLQPRPATTGSLDLMLPLQPKLLPGYNLQSSYLSNTLSTVRPPDIEFKPIVELIVEKQDSENSVRINSEDSKKSERKSSHDSDVEKSSSPKSSELDNDNANNYSFEINSNVIDIKETFPDLNDDSPNNNSY